MTETPGLDLERLAAWLPTVMPAVGAHLSASLVAGGKSNLTYSVSDGGATWILRRPPLGHVLATAHDMHREFRAMSALQDSNVPVPRTYAFCEDTGVLGAPFYLMEHVGGIPYRRAEELAALGAGRTREISSQLVDTLAALHAIDPESVGLGDFGRSEGFLARQVARWRKQLEASFTRELPAAEELYAHLVQSVPTDSATGIVHGDYRLDNVLMDADDRATAVLDWEMATIGDPLTDLALMLTYHRLGEGPAGAVVTNVALAPGFLDESSIINQYEAGSGRDLSRFGWYLGLAAYKLAAILEGIHYRHLAGQTVGDGFADIGDVIHPLLDAGLAAIKEDL